MGLGCAVLCYDVVCLHCLRHQFLAELGLKESNQGVYNGEWSGNGETFTSYNPATGKPIAQVNTCTKEEYDATMARMDEAFKVVAQVRSRTATRIAVIYLFFCRGCDRVLRTERMGPPATVRCSRCLPLHAARSCARLVWLCASV